MAPVALPPVALLPVALPPVALPPVALPLSPCAFRPSAKVGVGRRRLLPFELDAGSPAVTSEGPLADPRGNYGGQPNKRSKFCSNCRCASTLVTPQISEAYCIVCATWAGSLTMPGCGAR